MGNHTYGALHRSAWGETLLLFRVGPSETTHGMLLQGPVPISSPSSIPYPVPPPGSPRPPEHSPVSSGCCRGAEGQCPDLNQTNTPGSPSLAQTMASSQVYVDCKRSLWRH